MNWISGINILLVSTERAGDDPIDYCDYIEDNLMIYRRFGENTHHSMLAGLWKMAIAQVEKTPHLAFVVSTESTAAVDRYPTTGVVPEGGRDLAKRFVFFRKDGLERLTEEQVERFTEAWEAGIETASEILISRGWW